MSKIDAKNKLDEKLRSTNVGQQRPRGIMTLEQFVRERWLPARPVQNPNSAKTHTSKLNRHVLPVFGQQRLDRITRWDVQRFLTEKQKLGNSGAHVHGMRASLSKVLQAGVEWGFLDENPARGCRVSNREPAGSKST